MTKIVPEAVLLMILCALITFASLPALAGGLNGDPAALKRVEAMFQNLGGRKAWAEARSLYTMERARHPDFGDGIIASFWRDLEQPGEFAKLSHEKLEVKYAWSGDSGWILRNDELRDFDQDEMKQRLFYWHREIYTLYHQLARGERQLTVRDLGKNGFYVLDESGSKLGEFRLTTDGDLYLWRQVGGSEPVAYVYGPHKDFGEINFPDWGTSTDGGWGFYYVQVQPSSKPFSAHVNLTKPTLEWSGGAIHKDKCSE